MAIENTTVEPSNLRPIKSGHELLTVKIKESAVQTEFVTSVPLGKAYKKVTVIAAVLNAPATTTNFAGNSVGVAVIDTANIKVGYANTAAPASIVVTLECEN